MVGTGPDSIRGAAHSLLGEAGPRQVAAPPKVGLCHNAGGGASAGIVVHIFER